MQPLNPPERRRLIRPRRWPRRLLVLTNVVVLLTILGVGSAWAYVTHQLGSVRTGSGADLTTAKASDPENILLIGNETRAGQKDVNFGSSAELTGTLSDVIMVVHLDPADGQASLLSVPRDVFAPMPAGSPVGSNQKIDAALNDGAAGPNNLAEAISEDLGITINHYVEVDFDGFLNTVNALGGIQMDFPERLYDQMSNLDITQTGCQRLDGQEALALVRSRHLQYDAPGSGDDPAYWPYDPESDLARIARDHTFVRVLLQTAQSGAMTSPFRTNAFLSAVLSQLTIDPRLKDQLLSLAKRYRHLNPNSAPETTIPVSQIAGDYTYDGYQIGDVEFPAEPEDLDTIRSWDPGALPTPVRPSSVTVTNAVGAEGLAAQTEQGLQADGLPTGSVGNESAPADQVETVVQYHPGQVADGLDVLQHLSGAVVLQSSGTVPVGTVNVVAGTDFTVDAPPGGSTGSSSSGGSESGGSQSGGSQSATATAAADGDTAPSSSADQQTPYDPVAC